MTRKGLDFANDKKICIYSVPPTARAVRRNLSAKYLHEDTLISPQPKMARISPANFNVSGTGPLTVHDELAVPHNLLDQALLLQILQCFPSE